MKKTAAILFCGLTLAVAGCGENAGQRATTGAATGALIAGPIGAVAGAGLGGSGAVKVNP